MKTRMIVIATLFALLAAGCGGSDDVAGEPSVTTANGQSTETGPDAEELRVDPTDATLPDNTVPGRFDPAAQPVEGEPLITGEVPQEILDRVMADAASQADGATFDVVVSKAVTWSDGSLGCPEPGVLYTQALVEGYHVVLEGSEGSIDYRIGQSGNFFRCERTGTTPAGIGTIGGGDSGEPTG